MKDTGTHSSSVQLLTMFTACALSQFGAFQTLPQAQWAGNTQGLWAPDTAFQMSTQSCFILTPQSPKELQHQLTLGILLCWGHMWTMTTQVYTSLHFDFLLSFSHLKKKNEVFKVFLKQIQWITYVFAWYLFHQCLKSCWVLQASS